MILLSQEQTLRWLLEKRFLPATSIATRSGAILIARVPVSQDLLA
jgi:hypothetical protein